MGLGKKSILVVGVTNLTIVIRDGKFKKEIYAKFAVVDISLSYNAIFGQPILNNNGIIISVEYLCLKILAVRGIIVAKRSQKSA